LEKATNRNTGNIQLLLHMKNLARFENIFRKYSENCSFFINGYIFALMRSEIILTKITIS